MAHFEMIKVADPALAVLEMMTGGDGNAICDVPTITKMLRTRR
ncbi:MAG: hypothetical protein ABIS84_13740 [Arachnia sp.]